MRLEEAAERGDLRWIVEVRDGQHLQALAVDVLPHREMRDVDGDPHDVAARFNVQAPHDPVGDRYEAIDASKQRSIQEGCDERTSELRPLLVPEVKANLVASFCERIATQAQQ